MSGITDEAAIEGHDLIQRAEEEEERLHSHDRDTSQTKKQTEGAPGDSEPGGDRTTTSGQSTLDKVKEVLHLNK
ncbi:hypothetical protein CP533_1229 [Ophiocordyceps camponoti-saundersi (nom. inval.)]|nr:hypothetical protein CP533_1229 [Ophiocordyceps camponoti-saundersi (nom. inval.)]